jgi:hypothetical protein
VDDHAGIGARHLWEVRLQELGPRLRLGAGNVVVVVRLGAEGSLQAEQRDEQDQPGDDGAPRVPGGGPADPAEKS